ncbi:uncharacterized protein JCM6883_001055, partial [Sporobolomyces salmoneus]|uniref:uncharacterized protein n=1 Tax=Sporobolomyces salmoneus TaxID=183962 RepID=UPI0031756B9B
MIRVFCVRVEFATATFARVDGTLESATFEGDKVDPTGGMSRNNREYALMQQLLRIKQELDSIASSSSSKPPNSKTSRKRIPTLEGDEEEAEGDELAELEKKIEEKSFSQEVRKVAMREFKRLKKSPPQGAEYGVIRTYLETLISIPWTQAEATPLSLSRDFIDQARSKLDRDHYGLEKIKKRLLEWLAVLRLQQEQQQVVAQVPKSTAIVPYVASASSVESSTSIRNAHKSPILLLHGPPGV